MDQDSDTVHTHQDHPSHLSITLQNQSLPLLTLNQYAPSGNHFLMPPTITTTSTPTLTTLRLIKLLIFQWPMTRPNTRLHTRLRSKSGQDKSKFLTPTLRLKLSTELRMRRGTPLSTRPSTESIISPSTKKCQGPSMTPTPRPTTEMSQSSPMRPSTTFSTERRKSTDGGPKLTT